MDDPDCDSTWEEDEEEDGEGPSARGDEDGEAGAPGDADAEDEDEEDARAARPGALQPPRASLKTPGHPEICPDLRPPALAQPGDIAGRSRATLGSVCPEPNCEDAGVPELASHAGHTQVPAQLPGCFIEDILQNWREDYDLLEENHSYIQWLFPLREPGVNWHAKPLTLREIEAFKSSEEVRERFVQAYELMLGFYGIQLEDRDTGQVRRAQNYQKRFQNLNRHSHNNLRITRILKSLGELGLERYQAPLARFFLEETLVRGELPAVRQSALDYFVFSVRCARQRRRLLRFAWEHFRPRRKFVWGPHDKLRRLRPAEGAGSPGDPLRQAGASGRTCGPGRAEGGDGAAAGAPSPPGGALARDREGEAGGRGEEDPEPPSPKESKKRKLEASRREQGPGEPGAQSASDVEKIALNLEGCALSQSSLGGGSQELGSQAPGEAEQPGQQDAGAKVAEEVRKRRKVDQGPGDGASVGGDGGDSGTKRPVPARHGTVLGCPEAQEGENGVEEAVGWAGLDPAAPGSSATAGPWLDKEAEVGP
ncbi:opioid growth factor receptor isoform X2 [Lontra canadensis]|uniref:opioid growth factor receptor isoform X2 n=1 Tax=Lontra canadensis TaxID=76717 RepID=UPI0013F33B0A|nr:opioid growth factor receptor isoform X2 [Lontra canadensis]